jgi:hypothetical protein
MYSTIEKYEILTDDKVLRTYTTGTKKINLTNPQDISREPSKKVVDRILKDLNLELPKEFDIDAFMEEDINVDEEIVEVEDKGIQKINGLRVDSDGVILEEVSATTEQENNEN